MKDKLKDIFDYIMLLIFTCAAFCIGIGIIAFIVLLTKWIWYA